MNKHKKKLLCIISFAVVVSISFVNTKSVQADENFRVAKIKNFSGKVKIGKGGGEKTFDAIEGMSLVEGDSINTEKDSSVLLYIDDDKEVKIGDNSIVNLSELSGYINSDDQKTGISLWVGKIFSNIKKKLKIRSKYEIKVPTAVMGVRGTEFSVESLADGDIKVIVLEGIVTAIRTVVNDSEKYTTFEVTITKDQSASMNQKDESQNDIAITGIKVNEASQFVLEILKDFIERNPESLDENSKKEIYDEIEKRKAEKLAMEESSNDLYEIEKPSIKIDPIVEQSMSLNNVMTLADLENQNMLPPNVLPEGARGNQLFQANLFNAPAGQDRPAPPQPVIPPTQQVISTPAPTQAISGQSVPVTPATESVPPQPIQDEQKLSSENGGGTINSNGTNVNPPVTSVNIAPSAQNSSVETSYSTMTSGTIIASDVNGDTLNYSLITPAKHGTARVNSSTGAWEYTPAQQFTGTDSFVVTVSDGKGGSVSSTVTVIVMANLNTMPVAQNGNLNINQYTPTNGQLIATNVNANETLTYTVTSNPLHGTVILSINGSYTYTPYPNYHGVDSFKFKVNNGSVDSNEATVSINVMSVNNVPTAGNYNVQTDYNTMATGTIIASDPDADTLSYSVTTGAAVHGAVVIDSSTGEWEYTPAQQFSGIDSFVVTVSDGKGGSATSTVTVTVKPEVIVPPPPNTALTAEDMSITTLEDTEASGQLTAVNGGNAILGYSLTSYPANGEAIIDSNGSYRYIPNADYNGSDSFKFKANNGVVDSNEATVTITVTPVNDSPIVSDYNIQTNYSTMATGTISASDADGDTLSYAVTTGAAVYGTVVVDSSTGEWEYTPAQQFSGIDSFVVTVSDGKGGSATSTVTVTVKPEASPNTAPIAQDGSITTSEDTTANGQLTATDVDTNATLTYIVTSDPTHGIITVNSDGTYSYTPDANYIGNDSFKFKANDGALDSNEATMSINVIANLQSLKSTLNTKITDAQGWASTQVGSGVAECSSQAAIDQLNSAITSAQYIMSKNDATADEINGAITSLQNAVEQVKNNIVNTLMAFNDPIYASSTFHKVITVQPNIGNFLSTFSSSNITLGGDFAGLAIQSVSISQNLYQAQIELSGNLSYNTGIGTITINAAGWESTLNSKDITASIVVNP